MNAATGFETEDERVEAYRQMTLVRQFEEAAYRAYEAGEIAGTIHASIGQEAVAVGVVAALRADDVVLTPPPRPRPRARQGRRPGRLFAELLGRARGVSGGKGGSMHATDVDVGFFGSYAVVGGSIPLAVGVALAARSRGPDTVAVSFFGDGAVNQGVLYESLNLARSGSCPSLFVCENNGYAISVPAEDSTAGDGIVARAPRRFGLAARASTARTCARSRRRDASWSAGVAGRRARPCSRR